MAKSKQPRGLRIDENLFQSLSERKIISTAQSYVSYLELYYVSNYLKQEVENIKPWEELDKIDEKAIKDFSFKELHNYVGKVSDAYTSKTNIPPLEENNKDEIKKQIEAIRAEKIQKERDTPFGRKIWLKEQEERITALQNKIS